jgi:hypothetical protein
MSLSAPRTEGLGLLASLLYEREIALAIILKSGKMK